MNTPSMKDARAERTTDRQHEAINAMISVLETYADLPPEDLLALLSNLAGQLVAQQPTYTKMQAMDLVAMNVSYGIQEGEQRIREAQQG